MANAQYRPSFVIPSWSIWESFSICQMVKDFVRWMCFSLISWRWLWITSLDLWEEINANKSLTFVALSCPSLYDVYFVILQASPRASAYRKTMLRQDCTVRMVSSAQPVLPCTSSNAWWTSPKEISQMDFLPNDSWSKRIYRVYVRKVPQICSRRWMFLHNLEQRSDIVRRGAPLSFALPAALVGNREAVLFPVFC